MIFLTEILQHHHKKEVFFCGKMTLDNYLHHQANQDLKRKLAVCFVLVDKKTDLIKAYYTLSNNSIPLDIVPETIIIKLPKSYISIPTTLLGRLAVDKNFQGLGIGRLLLIDALKRSYEIAKSICSYAVVVDPLDHDARNFYDKYGFILLPDSKKMFLPMKTINQLFEF